MSYTPELNKPCTRNCKECAYANLCFEKESENYYIKYNQDLQLYRNNT